MHKALPYLLPLMAYPTALPADSGTDRVRGAGKWTWAAREALQTLASKKRVWIQADSPKLGQAFKEAILHWQEPPFEEPTGEYELKCYNKNLSVPVFGGFSFSHVVGLWLEFSASESAALLSPFISTEGLSFTPAEYIDLRKRLQAAIRRYERLPEVSRGLEDLNTGFFRHRSLEESQEFIANNLANYLAKGDLLHRDFLLTINRYDRAAIFAGRAELSQRRARLLTIRRAQEALKTLSGRSRKKALKQVLADWENYGKQYLLDLPAPASASEAEFLSQLKLEEENLLQYDQQLFRDLKAAGLGLNSLTVDPQLGAADQLKALEDRGRDLLREIDEAGLYQLPLRGMDAATTQRQLQQLEGLLEKLRNTRHHLGELPAFHDRRQFWYAQPAHLRRILAPLLTLPTEEWDAAFSSWYFERCLEKALRTGQPTEGPPAAVKVTPTPGATAIPAPEQLRLLGPSDNWPAQVNPEDLFISLSPAGRPSSPPRCRTLQLAPLHDTSAVPIALGGLRAPSLSLMQSFSPLAPPPWRVRYSPTAPAGQPQDRILVRGAGDWHPLPVSTPSEYTKLEVFFPATLNQADQQQLLQDWEQLIGPDNEIVFHHNFSPDDLTRALLVDGFTGSFLAAALLRAAEAAEAQPFEKEALVAMGREIRYRCQLKDPTPHPLAERVGKRLQEMLPDHFFEYHQPWRDTFLPLVILAPAGKKTVLLPDGRLPGFASARTEIRRQRELKSSGFRCLVLDAMAIWANPPAALRGIVQQITSY